MAVFRTAPRCPKCGKGYSSINRKNDGTFIGDDFVSWDIQGHVCATPIILSKEEAESCITTTDGKKFPMSNVRKQGGLKRDIIDLVLNLANPDDDCMLSDWLMALQFVLDKHSDQQNTILLAENERLKKALGKIMNDHDPSMHCYQVAEGALKGEPISDKWISVDKRLPHIGEEYNVVMDLEDGYEPVSSTLEFDSISKTWSYPGTDINVTKVTHWQPIPTPPVTLKGKG